MGLESMAGSICVWHMQKATKKERKIKIEEFCPAPAGEDARACSAGLIGFESVVLNDKQIGQDSFFLRSKLIFWFDWV